MDYINTTKEWLEHNKDPLFLLTLIFILTLAMWWGTTWKERAVSKGAYKRRKEFLNSIVADGVTECLEEACDKGRISKEEKDALYKRLASNCGIRDLHPKKHPVDHPEPMKLKEAIQSRISNLTTKLMMLRKKKEEPKNEDIFDTIIRKHRKTA